MPFVVGWATPRVKEDRFSAAYYSFNVNTLCPITQKGLSSGRDGWNVSSCVVKDRAELVRLLSASGQPATFDDGLVRLVVRDGGREWAVDQTGVVRTKAGDRDLSDADFERLLWFMLMHLPPNGGSILDSVKNRNEWHHRP